MMERKNSKRIWANYVSSYKLMLCTKTIASRNQEIMISRVATQKTNRYYYQFADHEKRDGSTLKKLENQ